MSRVGTLHCWKCGASVPVGAEVLTPDYGRLVSQARVVCLDCNLKSAEKDDSDEADSQRLAALVEGLRGLRDDFAPLRETPLSQAAAGIDALLRAHGFAPEAGVPREAALEPAGGAPTHEAG